MIYTDQHIHCQCSPDSHTPLREMAAAARDHGMSAVCFTDHIDMDFGNLGDLRWEARKDILRAAWADVRANPVEGITVRCGTVRHLLLGGVVAEQAVDLALDLLLGRLDLRTLEGKACKVLGQGDIVKRFHALPVAVLVQTTAVREVLVIVIFRAAVNSGGCAGSGRRRISGLGAACCAQHQRTGAEQADCLCDDLFQNKVPPVGTPASRRVQIRVA